MATQSAFLGSYFRSLLRSRRCTKCYMAGLLVLAALFFIEAKVIGDTRSLENALHRRVSSGHLARPEWYAAIWGRRAGEFDAMLCLALVACWPLVERRLPQPRAHA